MFNPALASLHMYLGEVEDTQNRVSFVDGGTVLKIPLFYLEGVVLFPEATLPLRIIQPSFLAAVERALNQANAPSTIGVVGDLIFCFACFGFSKYLVLFYNKKLLI
jgi:cereblon